MASKEIEEGSSFSTKAVLYSQDPGSRANRFYKMNRKTPFVKEFKDVALVLLKEISAPFKPILGIILFMLKKIKGQNRITSYIVESNSNGRALTEAKEKITLIKKKELKKSLLRKQQEPYRMKKRNKSKWWSINQSTNTRYSF
jgi:peptidyl-prolyl cis-trans isomerase SurA